MKGYLYAAIMAGGIFYLGFIVGKSTHPQVLIFPLVKRQLLP